MRAFPEEEVGARFGTLVVSGQSVIKNKKKYYPCSCDCGSEKDYYAVNLRKGLAACQDCYFTRRRMCDTLRGPAQVMRSYKSHAKDAGRVFALDLSEVQSLISQPCTYCGRVGANCLDSGYRYNGIDRVNSSLGYTSTNVVPCCWDCNRMKGKMSHADFMTHLARILYYTQTAR